MTLTQVLGVCLLCAVSALVLREAKSPLAPFLTLGGGILLLLSLLPRIEPIVTLGSTLADALPEAFGETVGKVLSVGFLCGVGSDTCTELGAASLGTKLELWGKIEIFLLALPLFTELLSRAEALLS